jgi:hypothetical protein
MTGSTHPAAVHIQDPGKVHPIVAAAVGRPTVLVVSRIGFAVGHIDSEVPAVQVALGEVGTGSVGDRGVEEMDQRDESNSRLAVECLYLRRT